MNRTEYHAARRALFDAWKRDAAAARAWDADAQFADRCIAPFGFHVHRNAVLATLPARVHYLLTHRGGPANAGRLVVNSPRIERFLRTGKPGRLGFGMSLNKRVALRRAIAQAQRVFGGAA